MSLLEKDLNELPSGLNGLLYWAAKHELFTVLDGATATDPSYAFPRLIAVGATRRFELTPGRPLQELDAFLVPSSIGYMVQVGYGLKDWVERLSSRHNDPIGFPALFVYEPLVLIRILSDQKILIQASHPETVWAEMLSVAQSYSPAQIPSVSFRSKGTREEYLEKIASVQSHIRRGDCYELNYCQEFYAEQVQMDPVAVFEKMRSVVQAPFSCLYRNGNRWLIGASPERFLKKTGDRLETRPMKGTAPRDTDPLIDKQLSSRLQQSAKDRSENIMVVDLVRNDLSRVSERGTVQVEALCALHSFTQVHQLVSTVSGRIRADLGFRSILEACFPMGSMTGAPKVRVMELTDQYEWSARGLYSGSIGFMEPNGDFDLNVVIRSLQYESTQGYLSYHVGSGITAYSEPQKEWDECGWKSAGIRKVFGE